MTLWVFFGCGFCVCGVFVFSDFYNICTYVNIIIYLYNICEKNCKNRLNVVKYYCKCMQTYAHKLFF